MNDILLVIFWMMGTLLATTIAAILGRRWGVEIPIAFMVTLVLAGAVLANKMVVFGPFYVPAAVIVASATFLLTDILAEMWGREAATRAVWIGFLSMAGFTLALYTGIYWTAAPFALESAEAFDSVLGQTPRIAAASIIAYLVSQHHDVWAFHFWKRLCNNRHLWLRNNASTIISQGIDSALFITIAFYGTMPVGIMILSQWAVKIIIALLDTPFIYLSRWLINAYDRRVETIAADW